MRVDHVNNSNPKFKGYLAMTLGVSNDIQQMNKVQKAGVNKLFDVVKEKPYNVLITKDKIDGSTIYRARYTKNCVVLNTIETKKNPSLKNLYNFIVDTVMDTKNKSNIKK